jgi:hypothetical protein
VTLRWNHRAVFLLALLLAGCCLNPVYVVERPAIEHALPDGVHMGDYVGKDVTGLKMTVGMKLARLGAHLGTDGKLYDLSGKPIDFFVHYDGGMAPLPEISQRADQHLKDLKKTCNVIEILHDPDLPPPA